jgi:hypothetical protein
MPIGPYPDFDACLADGNSDAYCGALERITNAEAVEGDWEMILFGPDSLPEMPDDDMGDRKRMADLNGDGIDDETGEPVVEMPEDMPEPMIEPDGEQDGEEFHSLLVVEGTWTGDGRWIEEGALSWRDLPLPLMATDRTTEGHADAVLVGQITRIEREGREIHAWGRFVNSDDADIMRLQGFIKAGDLRGISVDLDSLEYDIVMPAEGMDDEIEDEVEDETGNRRQIRMSSDDAKMIVTSARIMGATVVPFPAFQEAFIESLAAAAAVLQSEPFATGWITMQSLDGLDFSPPVGARQEAARGLAWREEYGRGGTAVGVARARDLSNGRNLTPTTVNRMASYFARHEIDKQGAGWRPGEDGYPSAGRIAWALWGGDPGWAWARKMQRSMNARIERGSITAAAIEAPVVPPSSWFRDPKMSGPTPLTICDDGRVFGHLAVWGQCHIAYSDSCVTPPRSAASYAHFLTGELLCEDGTRVPVGQITMDTGHAPLNANPARALAHYDDTGAAIADVCAGEDRHGIWLAGALRPGLSPEKVRAVMAADVSGDWRRIGSALELIAVLSVNVPGFPKNRIAVREHEGMVASLVASLVPRDTVISPVERRNELERRAVDRIAATIGRDVQSRKVELAQRVQAAR